MTIKQGLVIVLGPTAVGKTRLGIELASRTHGEVVSADSMQIYTGMDIGTAKTTVEEMNGIPHWGMDLVSPDTLFTVADYQKFAESKIADIASRGRRPYVVGGTGLYIRSVTDDMEFAIAEENPVFRESLREQVDMHGPEWLHQKLFEVDPVSATRLHPNDIKRVIRALEVFHTLGKPMSQTNSPSKEKYELCMIGLTMRDRSLLYERINQRVDLMIEQGLVAEVEQLLQAGYTREFNSMLAIGYKEIADYLTGKTSLQEAIELVKQGSRRYAKRQLSWFRRDDRIQWYEVDVMDHEELFRTALGQVQEFWSNITNNM